MPARIKPRTYYDAEDVPLLLTEDSVRDIAHRGRIEGDDIAVLRRRLIAAGTEYIRIEERQHADIRQSRAQEQQDRRREKRNRPRIYGPGRISQRPTGRPRAVAVHVLVSNLALIYAQSGGRPTRSIDRISDEPGPFTEFVTGVLERLLTDPHQAAGTADWAVRWYSRMKGLSSM